jgi:rhomboid protease GluP
LFLHNNLRKVNCAAGIPFSLEVGSAPGGIVDDQQAPDSWESAPQEIAFAATPTQKQSLWQIAPATIVLIALNTLVFLLMVFRGVSFVSPSAESVLPWGANYGPLTLSGQWWRLFACLFIHFGIIHIAMNMFVLLSIGPVIESLCGRVVFLLLYLISGVGGDAGSLVWHPTIVSAGASGAIFGLYGALLGLLALHRRTIAPDALKSLSRSGLTFVGYNILFSLRPGVDMAAHLGGLVAGFLLALFLVQRDPKANRTLGWRAFAALAAGITLTVVTVRAVPAPGDILGEFKRLDPIEKQSLALYNASVNNWNAHKISDKEFADTIEQQILPSWKSERDAISKLKNLPADQNKIVVKIVKYMDARTESWNLLAEGLRAGDASTVKQAFIKSQEAGKLLKNIGNE